MASRLLSLGLRQLSRPALSSSRNFTTTRSLLAEPPIAATAGPAPPIIAPVKKPVGAFRGGLTGFLLGATLAGGGMYYYVLNEYRVSNELLIEDIFSLQSTVQRIESYVKVLEDKVTTQERKK